MTDPAAYDPENITNPNNYINRELALLAFQYRVLEEAMDPANPLLERVKFLAIVGANLDEFFMVRVGGLELQQMEGVTDLSIDGMTAAEQLAAIRRESYKLMKEARRCFHEVLIPELDNAGIHVRDYADLPEKQKAVADEYFHQVVYPVLTPLAFDPGHPFPHISNLSLNLAVAIEDPQHNRRFARVKVPDSFPILIPLKASSGSVRKDGTVPYNHYFVWNSHVIKANLASLFPGMKVVEAHAFHVTRNADLEIQDLESDDLLETMEENVRKRRFGHVVRLMVQTDMPEFIRQTLVENLLMDPKDVYIMEPPLSLGAIMQMTRIERLDLKYRSFQPAIPEPLRPSLIERTAPIFDAIRTQDILLHQPYDSFSPVVEFLRAASRDPKVLAIKMTLYRVGSNSPVVQTLLEARRDYGKQVAVLVELKARFDEESNISWAKMLEQEGVHVTYGLVGLKTHCKIALVVRQEGEGIRRYIHLGTGNYNHITASMYEDLGLFTVDDDIGADASDLFNYLTGYSLKQDYRKLLVAPINLRQGISQLIQDEIDLHKRNGHGHLIFKFNSLSDAGLIRQLYQASQAGVKVDLLVRGLCCLRPGIPGLSENIRVISIVGRFLEHSRVYYFRNGGSPRVYMGSADLMPRNLDRRVEVLFPVEDPNLAQHVHSKILRVYLSDNVKSRLMQPDGAYERIQPRSRRYLRNVQEMLIKHESLPADEEDA
ncbi:MAG: polyphosphate kinase 1 [Anaerolineae bacterium]|nr:polyphosphate kinase 1 [Anaerolineae bacterium]